MNEKEIKRLLGKYLFVPLPKDITNELEAKIWYMRISDLREKGKPFGGYTVSFEGDKTTLEELFGSEPIATTQMTKKIWDYIKSKKEK